MKSWLAISWLCRAAERISSGTWRSGASPWRTRSTLAQVTTCSAQDVSEAVAVGDGVLVRVTVAVGGNDRCRMGK